MFIGIGDCCQSICDGPLTFNVTGSATAIVTVAELVPPGPVADNVYVMVDVGYTVSVELFGTLPIP